MFFYRSPFTNPYFNIAAEEFFLKNFPDDFFFLYINEPSVIVGKHQNTWAEINIPFVIENQIPVIRRLSGGGTVFHDLGNLNYCFIQKGAQGHLVDFKKYSQPVIDTLQQLGVHAHLRGKSDLVINGFKFSGNAEHVYRNKVLHHGTMLFQSELSRLNEAIRNDWNKFTDKAVRSNRSQVTNISEHLTNPVSLPEFIEKIKVTVFKQHPQIKDFFLSSDDLKAVEKLMADKYETWEWNFAYSPSYEFSKSVTIDDVLLMVDFRVEKGLIQHIHISWETRRLTLLEELLHQQPHQYLHIKELLVSVYPQLHITIPLKEFLQNLF